MLDLSCTDALHVWFCVNGMALNPDKCKTILLGTSQWANSYSNLATINIAGCQDTSGQPDKNSWCDTRQKLSTLMLSANPFTIQICRFSKI